MAKKRITLIHALRESQVPIWEAFAAGWPEADIYNLLDDSLSADLAAEGKMTDAIIQRFLTLGRYAAQAGAGGKKTDAILFTCSAFGPAINAVKADLHIPVLHPNEAAFERAVSHGPRVGLAVTFPPSLQALSTDLRAVAAAAGRQIQVEARLAEGALAALQGGNPGEHDRLVAEAVQGLPAVDSIVLGQFSMARAAKALKAQVPVLTTPDCAVAKLRQLLAA